MSKNQQPSRGPDYGMSRILRGYTNFEDIYQGQGCNFPIPLSLYQSQTQGRDASAFNNYSSLSAALKRQTTPGLGPPADSPNVDGFTSPNLVAGVPVTFGTNVVFGFPRPTDPDLAETFLYKIIWRVRTIDTLARTGQGYHATLRGFRYTDTEISTADGFANTDGVWGGAAAQRVPLPTYAETVRFTTQPPTTGLYDPLVGKQSALDLGLQPGATYDATITLAPEGARAPMGPLLPFVGRNALSNLTTGADFVLGELGQNPVVSIGDTLNTIEARRRALLFRTSVSHVTYSTVAKGDEAIVLVYPRPLRTGEELYDFDNFATGQLLLSLLFGRGGWRSPDGLDQVYLPDGAPFGVTLIQGYS